MIVLDTDHVSHLESATSSARENLLSRLLQVDDNDIATTRIEDWTV